VLALPTIKPYLSDNKSYQLNYSQINIEDVQTFMSELEEACDTYTALFVIMQHSGGREVDIQALRMEYKLNHTEIFEFDNLTACTTVYLLHPPVQLVKSFILTPKQANNHMLIDLDIAADPLTMHFVLLQARGGFSCKLDAIKHTF